MWHLAGHGERDPGTQPRVATGPPVKPEDDRMARRRLSAIADAVGGERV